MNIHDRRLLLVLSYAQFAVMFPDLKDHATEQARIFMQMSVRDLYDYWQFAEACDLLPDAACYARLAQMKHEVEV